MSTSFLTRSFRRNCWRQRRPSYSEGAPSSVGSRAAWKLDRARSGNRSILADPTIPEMKDKINSQVKHREAFRPFAPSCPIEDAPKYFEQNVSDPFMLKVCYVRPEMRVRLPAITHVDGTARLQTVEADTNPRFYRLLKEFEQLSGVPVLLNTSFNVMGEPIVESPNDAIRCFFTTGLDYLLLGNCLLEKGNRHKSA